MGGATGLFSAVLQPWVQEFGVECLVVARRHTLLGLHHMVKEHQRLDPCCQGTYVDDPEQGLQVVI